MIRSSSAPPLLKKKQEITKCHSLEINKFTPWPIVKKKQDMTALFKIYSLNEFIDSENSSFQSGNGSIISLSRHSSNIARAPRNLSPAFTNSDKQEINATELEKSPVSLFKIYNVELSDFKDSETSSLDNSTFKYPSLHSSNEAQGPRYLSAVFTNSGELTPKLEDPLCRKTNFEEGKNPLAVPILMSQPLKPTLNTENPKSSKDGLMKFIDFLCCCFRSPKLGDSH